MIEDKLHTLVEAKAYFDAGGLYVVTRESYEILRNFVLRQYLIQEDKASAKDMALWGYEGLTDPKQVLKEIGVPLL